MRRFTVALVVLAASTSVIAGAAARTGSNHRLSAEQSANQPDQVIQWNQTMLALLQTTGAQPATIHPTRTMAITQLAVYDAVNAIEGGGTPYIALHAPRDASPAAAAAAAADTVLLSLLPSQKAAIDAKFQDSLSQIGGGERVRRGIRVGQRAADAILAARANDGSNTTPPCLYRSLDRANTS